MSKTFQFSLTQQEADVIVQVLAEQPYKVSGQLIPKLQTQYQQQVQADNGKAGPVQKPEELKEKK